jgi:serine protease Do
MTLFPMNKEVIKQYIPSFFAGFFGAFTCLLIVGGVATGLWYMPSLQNNLHDRFQAIIDRAVVEKNLTDSAGNHSDVIDVVDATNPAVISIVITKDVPKLEQIFQQGNSPFGWFSFGLPQYRQNGTEKKEIGGGSGFLVSSDGYVVTNAHVVSDDEAEYTVFLNDGTSYTAAIVATDETLDVAVLKIEANDVPFLEFGDSDTVKVGQTVVAIGNALGEFRNTVSAGVISGLSRSITAGGQGTSEVLADVLQTDAAINPGNSGGPLLDLSGRVIGVNVATSSGGENISFALPSNAVKQTVDSIREYGHVVRAYLGVRFVMVNAAFAEANDLPVEYGALIRRSDDSALLAVVPGSPADKAGIEENDLLTEIDGIKLDDEHPLNVVLRKYAVGDTITVKLWHDGAEKTVTVTLVEAPLED